MTEKKQDICPMCGNAESVAIICDMCGKSCLPNPGDPRWGFEYATLEASWGFLSDWDLECHYAHFCIECYKKIKKFIEDNGGKINVESKMPM